jgi:hypothetical protein
MWMIIAIAAAIINMLFGLFVYIKNPRQNTNIFFSLMAFSIGFWNFTDLTSFIKNSSIALFCLRGIYIAGIFIPIFYIHFIISIVRDVVYKNWKKTFVIIYSGAIILLSLMFTPFIIRDVALEPYKEIPGSLYFLFIIFFAGSFFYGFYIQFMGFKNPEA